MKYSKKFYSDKFNIFFTFKENGSTSGAIVKPGIRREFSGIFVENDTQVSLTFFSEIAGILTCFTGEIFNYRPNEEFLWLRSSLIGELQPGSPVISDCKSVLLFDCPEKVHNAEIRRIIDIPPDMVYDV